jgi:hypothetical protein
MADGRVNNGGKRPGAGRKPKPVEDAGRAMLLELYAGEAERGVIVNMIAIASSDSKQAVSAASWLDERKYGKVKDKVEHDGGLTIKVEYANPDSDTPEAPPESA